jgi:hypothetical protein
MSAALPSTDISKRRMNERGGGGGDLFFLLLYKRPDLAFFLPFLLSLIHTHTHTHTHTN